ncbi:MAG: cadherin-like domain-containing protein [Magnetovibrio sp.]|nr:cadherin-like domain-containing protein [Magnetovibrio sp.]
MRTLTFTLDTQTGNDAMAPATLTVTELADGSLSFSISNEGDGDNMIADLRGLFFDVAADDLLGTLSVSGDDVTEVNQSGSVDNLGGGSTSSGVPDSPYEIGIEFGTSGQAQDDIQTTEFVLSSSLRSLTLDDLAFESFTVRQTSVGEVDGDRSDSDKLYGDAPYAVNAQDDSIVADEDQIQTGNVFSNDIDLDAPDADNDGILDLNVTAVNGSATQVGQTIELADGIGFTLNANGEFTLDTNDADYLSAGEVVSQTYSYSVDDGNGGSDTAQIQITVTGVNDDPTAVADTNVTDEQTVISGNVLDNDYDIDQLDTISVTAVDGDSAGVGNTVTLASGAMVALNVDGTYDYDPNGAFDDLNEGESAQDSFTYQITDNNGAVSTATVDITVNGIGANEPEPPTGDHFGTFLNKKGTAEHDISNIVMYLSDDGGDVTKVKIDGWSGVSDLDDVDLFNFVNTQYSEYDLLAVSIKAGNNHNKDLGPGEGQLFLLDGDEDIDYFQGGTEPDGLAQDVLQAHADETLDYSADLFG